MLRTLALRTLPALFLSLGLVLLVPPACAERESDAARRIEQEYGVVGHGTSEARRLNEQLDRVAARVVGAVNASSGRAEFRLQGARLLGGHSEKSDRVVNAFALPDGHVYVTLGLARLVQESPRSDDELAFVLGHEITHVVQRHTVQEARGAAEAGLLAVILGSVTKSSGLGSLGTGTTASFNRKDEYEADKGGLLAMYRAGFDTRAAVTLLNRLKASADGRYKLVNGWFGTHPLTENRVERLKEMISDLQDGRELKERSDRELERDDRRPRARD